MPTFSDISDQLAYQAIELPSWAFGNSGTRIQTPALRLLRQSTARS